MKTERVHELTVAEISRLTGEYNRRRHECTEQLAALFSAAEAGQPEERPQTGRAEEVRALAVEILNGFAPPGMKRAPPNSRKAQLEVERDAIDLVLAALSTKELAARAEEAAEFAVEHGAEWEALCRDIVLCAVRLGALERRAIEWRQKLGPAVPSSLPMAGFIGTGRSILNVAWGADPLSRVRAAAVEARIVTAKEIKATENA
jgi:hypothetical protein